MLNEAELIGLIMKNREKNDELEAFEGTQK